jgi:ABC-2 type transport system permease protein
MRKAWLVAKREYLYNVKRRSFLFAAFGVPLMVVVIMAIVTTLVVDAESNIEQVGMVGYVDLAGVLDDPVDVPEDFRAYATEEEAQVALEGGEIGAYFVIAPDYMDTGNVQLVSEGDMPEALTDTFDEFLIRNLGDELDPALLERLSESVNLSIQTLDNGRVIRDNAIVALIIMPIVFTIVFIIASQTTSGYLMSGVVEEKSNRIMEILVTSITPLQLLFGKIIGLGALGLTQLVIWIGGAVIIMALGQNLSFLAGVTVPPDLIVIGLIYFLLDYFLFGSIMAGIGAVVGSEQESRQIAGVFGFVTAIPFFFVVAFITDPNGTAATFLTLFPLTSPIAVIIRLGFGSIPTWQLILSITLLALTTVFAVWASARIFRWSLLLYGKRPSLREVLRVLRRPPTMATTATGEGTG